MATITHTETGRFNETASELITLKTIYGKWIRKGGTGRNNIMTFNTLLSCM